MSEKNEGGPRPEEMGVLSEEEQRKKDLELWKLLKEDFPEPPAVPEASKESELNIAEFEALIDAFEATHSLDALNAIIDLTVAEAKVHPVREPARNDLAPIFAKLNKIDVTHKQYAELKARWMRISNAVGMINNNKVDHDR